MKNKKILIIIVIIVVALFVFFVLVPDKTNVEITNKNKEVILYFATDNAMYLQGEKRLVAEDNLYQNTIDELIKGPDSSALSKTIPRETNLLGLEIKNGTAFINFNKELQEKHWGGSAGERMTVYSIVNTLTQFSEITKVQILIVGEEIETLAGHMDLSIPLAANESLIKKE